MAEDLQAIVPVDNAEARRELLEKQFAEVEPAEDKPAKAEKAEVEVKARDGDGRYAKAAPEPVVEEPTEEPVWKRPPASWRKEFHEAWQTVDPRIQEYAWQREEQMRAGLEPFAAKAQYADQMQRAMQPYMQTIQGLGIQPHQAVEALMKADYTLRNSSQTDRLAYFSQLAQQYGVNLGQIGELPQQLPIDPTVYALQNELNAVRGEVLGWKQQQEEAQNSALLGEINKFSQKAEHFEEARPTMIQLLQGGVATDLQDAYEKAVRLDPNLSDAVNQGRQAEVDAQRRSAANKAAKSARAAAVSVRSSTPGAQTTPKAQDRRSLLSEQFDGINERL